MATSTNIPEFSNSDIWSMFKETGLLIKELRESQKETSLQIKETNRILSEKQSETDKLIKETNRILSQKQSETDRLIKDLAKQLGGMANSNGDAATEFFYNTLKYKRKKLFGESFDDIFKEEKRKTKKGFEDEYDVLMFNCRAVCIVEIKYKADTDDIVKTLRKVITFRENFPEHSNKILYLAVASMSFHKRTEKACIDNGIAIIKQVGETIIIQDEHLKTF